MVTITIRNVPDDVRDELAARAQLTGRSLQEYLQGQLAQLTARPDPDVVVARMRARTQQMDTALSAERILQLRDAERP